MIKATTVIFILLICKNERICGEFKRFGQTIQKIKEKNTIFFGWAFGKVLSDDGMPSLNTILRRVRLVLGGKL